MEPIRAIIQGLQYGDEGKGKIVDETIDRAKSLDGGRRILCARFQGGPNAGHTILVPTEDGVEEFVTHAAPSGLAHNVDVAMGPHFAFDPEQFVSELEEAEERFGYDGRVLISGKTGVLLDYHRILDAWKEDNGSDIGTTKSGMGPFYMDNAARDTRIRMVDYVSDDFPDKLREVIGLKAERGRLGSLDHVNLDDLVESIVENHEPVRKRLEPFVENLPYRMREYLQNGDHIIVEGAQGTHLDVDWGDQHYVTSSHLLAGDALSRLALPMEFDIYGVEKIYPTRVGGGNLPTMTNQAFSNQVQKNAGEAGATTGRPRRVGYPDWALVRLSAMLNDLDGIYLTRADCVQDTPLKVGLGYIVDGEVTEEFPQRSFEVEGVNFSDRTYEWRLWEGPRDLSDPEEVHKALEMRRAEYVSGGFESFPNDLRDFIRDHDEYVGVETIGVSIGPARGETVLREEY